MLIQLEKFFDRMSDYIGYFCSFLMLAMMLNIFYDVFMRYVFKTGSIAFQELEWHIFSIIILLGTSYALKEDAHVRVDILYTKFSEKNKALVNIAGAFLFITPIALLIALGSVGFVMEAYTTNEISGDPGGLTHRWLLKALIPLSFWLLIFIATGFVIKNINIYRRETGRLPEVEDH
ncbi:MAG: TRAP transporter small permease subunit [Sulfurospirillaceae bacterium]|nr:TRAP transporter small permease subunit [Sulfurospirillaceae bacterium]MDD2827335.1 TRAP transporter small permease subunit [Sulfurospirillaceae bacterium]